MYLIPNSLFSWNGMQVWQKLPTFPWRQKHGIEEKCQDHRESERRSRTKAITLDLLVIKLTSRYGEVSVFLRFKFKPWKFMNQIGMCMTNIFEIYPRNLSNNGYRGRDKWPKFTHQAITLMGLIFALIKFPEF